MKKRIFLSIGLILLLAMLCSCGSGIKSDEAKATVNDFVVCINEARYADAAALMHADCKVTVDALQDYFASLAADTGADFSNGIEITGYNGFSSSLYDSNVDGSRYELRGKASVGEYQFSVTFEVVRNDNGYGLYNVHFTPID